MRMPIYHTTTMPSNELTLHLSKLKVIAALAKLLNQPQLYNQAKDAHDQLVKQYKEQTKPKKKGFWEQFKDNLTFRDLDTHVAMPLFYLEEDSFYTSIYDIYKDKPQHELVALLNQTIATLK